MAFRRILIDMIRSVDGAFGATFLDKQGESVETVSVEVSRYQMQVIGAYHGIFLERARRMCNALDHGSPDRYKIEWERVVMFNSVLTDGYYLVLIARRGTNEGMAWRELYRCRDRILKEIE